MARNCRELPEKIVDVLSEIRRLVESVLSNFFDDVRKLPPDVLKRVFISYSRGEVCGRHHCYGVRIEDDDQARGYKYFIFCPYCRRVWLSYGSYARELNIESEDDLTALASGIRKSYEILEEYYRKLLRVLEVAKQILSVIEVREETMKVISECSTRLTDVMERLSTVKTGTESKSS